MNANQKKRLKGYLYFVLFLLALAAAGILYSLVEGWNKYYSICEPDESSQGVEKKSCSN